MSARELHRFCRDSGRQRPSFRDIKPFVDEKRFSLITNAQSLARCIAAIRREGGKVPDRAFHLIGTLHESGVLIHPLDLNICLRLDTQPLAVDGARFHVYFHELEGRHGIGGTFLDTGDKPTSSVFLSLNMAMHMVSSYLASNNLQAVDIQRIGTEFLLQKQRSGTLSEIPQDVLRELSAHLVGTRLFEAEVNRLIGEDNVEQYMQIVQECLSGIALHEAAHVLHRQAGIIGKGGRVKEEMRAYLTELSYGNPGLTFAYLPAKKSDDANCEASKEIIQRLLSRAGLESFLKLDRKMLSSLSKELLDEEFMKSFGAHHDEIIPRIEIQRVRRHRFLGPEHTPMLEGLRYLPQKKAA